LHAPILTSKGDFQVIDTREIATSWRACLAGALLMTWLDVIIDPLTVHGDRWFLGRMYYYPAGGIYFGVPLSNFVGWFVVGVTTIRLFQLWERRRTPDAAAAGARHMPYAGSYEPLVYLGILIFNLTLTFWIGETLLGVVGIVIYVPIVTLVLIHVLDRRRHATADEVAAYVHDHPHAAKIVTSAP
jgi:putative membrane protein